MFETNAARGAAVTWRVTSPRGADMEVHLARDASISTVRLEENITLGQSVVRYALFGADTGAWRELTRGSTIGYAKLDRFAPTTVRKLKLVIEDALDVPEPIGLAAY
jgi:alpha-L-fucosidase